MSDISTLIYRYLQQNFGKLDWSLGSVIRELVAQPLVKLSEEADTIVNDSYSKLDIATLAQNPEENADAIDKLFTELGLEATQPTVSTGSVQILTASSDDFILPANTGFSYGDITLVTTQTYNVTSLATQSNDIQLKQIGIDSYTAIVPVTSITTGVNIAAGEDLSWGQISSDVYEVKVYSAVTGGTGAYTATEKINDIQQKLFPTAVSGAKSIINTLNSGVPNSVVDCVFAQSTDKNTSGIYVKTTAAPETWVIEGEGKSISVNQCKVSIDGTGIYAVKKVNGTLIGSTNIVRVGRQLEITYSGTAGNVSVEVFGLKTLPELQRVLDSYLANTGVRFDLLSPALVALSMYLPLNGINLSSTNTNAISDAINNSPINASNLGDYTVRSIIESQGGQLISTGIYTLESLTSHKTVSTPSTANVSPFIEQGIPVAVYSAMNLISTNNG